MTSSLNTKMYRDKQTSAVTAVVCSFIAGINTLDTRFEALLPEVAEAILDGRDIATTFPNFWKAIQNNSNLSQKLDDLVFMLTPNTPIESKRQSTTAFPLDLTDHAPAHPIVHQYSSTHWDIQFHQTARQIHAKIMAQSLASTQRGSQCSKKLTLIQKSLRLEQSIVSLTIALQYKLGSDFITPILILETTAPSQPKLKAILQWGANHHHECIINQTNTHFAPIPFQSLDTLSVDAIPCPLNIYISTI